MSEPPRGFAGLSVVSFESRRSVEMAALIGRHGGVAVRAPSMREVAHDESPDALRFADALRSNDLDVVVLMTGVGTRALLVAMAEVMPPEEVATKLAGRVVLARGPKPAAVLRELGLRGFLAAPEPNSWREVLDTLRGAELKKGARIAIQEHGAPSTELYAALRADGFEVTPMSVYEWALPEDTAPLRAALHDLAEGRARIALFTSATQVAHALRVAQEEGIAEAVRARLARGVVASIGPVCSGALRAEGLAPDLEPEHPKMGHLVKETAARAASILAAKV